MASSQSRQLDRKKLLADPFMVLVIILVLGFLLMFVVYPLLTMPAVEADLGRRSPLTCMRRSIRRSTVARL